MLKPFKNSPIVTLDEATSTLDVVTETCIQDSLSYFMKGKTVLVIAQRLDKGKIVEDGAHEELLIKNGLYTRLWKSQAKEFFTVWENS